MARSVTTAGDGHGRWWQVRVRSVWVAVGSAAALAEVQLPEARPLDDRRYEATDARQQRGEYLVERLLQCFLCHSERDWNEPGAPPLAGRMGAGAVWSERGERRFVASNITPDPGTGASRWTDDMLARAIREGIGHDGRALHPAMYYGSYAAPSPGANWRWAGTW